MRPKTPCNVCETTSCSSGFVFKSSISNCVCKTCYYRQKRSEKVSAIRKGSNSAENLTGEPIPVVINLEGMYTVLCCIFSVTASVHTVLVIRKISWFRRQGKPTCTFVCYRSVKQFYMTILFKIGYVNTVVVAIGMFLGVSTSFSQVMSLEIL